MYKVCGKMYSKAGHGACQLASQPVTFSHSSLSFFFLGGEKDHHT